MKKTLSIVLVLVFLMAVPLLAFDADNTIIPAGNNTVPKLEMTEQQKAQMINLKTQILELKKQIIKKNVENGTISKEQGHKMEDRINTKLKSLESGELGFPHRNHSPKCKSH